MTSRLRFAIASMLMLCALPSRGEQPPGPPPPAPELKELSALVGDWKCTGSQNATDVFGPARAVLTDFQLKPDLDGFWYAVRWIEKKTKENPMPFKLAELWGYDPGTKEFTRAGGFAGGGWTVSRAPKWDGNRLVFTGDLLMGPQKIGVRQTFIKKGPKEIADVVEIKPNDQWIELGKDICKR